MEYNRSDPADDRVVFYIEDKKSADFQNGHETRGLYPLETEAYPSRTSSVYSQSGRSRRSCRAHNEGEGRPRRASLHGGKSRSNNCNGSTPLGDGRRASINRKNRPRRGSTVRRKDSFRPSGKNVTEDVTKVQIPVVDTPVTIEQDRKRRKIVMIILGIFIFLLVASILVVVITLTHSSFHHTPNDNTTHTDPLHK